MPSEARSRSARNPDHEFGTPVVPHLGVGNTKEHQEMMTTLLALTTNRKQIALLSLLSFLALC